jgi:Tfp pilus assembly protein PilX
MRPRGRRGSGQRGVVLIFTLIVLLILTIGAVALMRSMNTSLSSSGNMAFRRDLTNQGEWAISKVLDNFSSGAMTGLTGTSNSAANYSAIMLPTNPQGVPMALLNSATFATVGSSANDINGASADVTIRYIIDRLCTATGAPSAALCSQAAAAPTGGSGGPNAPVTPPSSTVYRLSVRISGARSTQVFLQTTFTMPGS